MKWPARCDDFRRTRQALRNSVRLLVFASAGTSAARARSAIAYINKLDLAFTLRCLVCRSGRDQRQSGVTRLEKIAAPNPHQAPASIVCKRNDAEHDGLPSADVMYRLPLLIMPVCLIMYGFLRQFVAMLYMALLKKLSLPIGPLQWETLP